MNRILPTIITFLSSQNNMLKEKVFHFLEIEKDSCVLLPNTSAQKSKTSMKSFVSAMLLLFFVSFANAATRYSVANGKWKATSSWATTEFETPGAATSLLVGNPGAGIVTISCTVPTVFDMTGVGGTCSGANSDTAIGLANSQTGVNYQLYRGATAVGAAVSGTGSAISFGVHNATGTYTVVATSAVGGCTATMTGSVTVIKYNTPVLPTATVTDVNCPTDATGKITMTTAFSPASLKLYRDLAAPANGHVNLGTSLLSNRNAFTVEGWIKFDKTKAVSGMSIFGQNDVIEVIFEGTNLRVWTNHGAVNMPLADFPADNAWHHIAATGDGKNVSLYFDGVLKGIAGGTTTSYGSSSDTAKIGWAVSSTGGACLDGEVLKVGFWNRALSASEITTMSNGFAIYEASQSGLLAGYNFNEGAGTTLAGVGSVVAPGTITNVGALWTDPYTYSWTSAPAGFTSNLKDISGLTPRTYNLTTSLKNCTSVGTWEVKANNPAPTITTAATLAVCQSAAVQTTTMAYTATANSPTSYSIDWATLTDQGSTVFPFVAGAGSVTGISVPAGTTTGTYTGTMTVANANGCTAAIPITLRVNALPTAGLSSNDADNAFCTGTSVTFTATGGTNYNFRVAGLSVQNGASATYTTTSLTNGQVVDVIVTNATNCTATSAGITNVVNSGPAISLTKTDETCPSSNNGTITTGLTGGLSNIRYIKLTQKYVNADAWQQVAEIEAFEVFTGTNVARSSSGAVATSSTNFSASYLPIKAIDGDNSGTNNFWHSGTANVNEWIKVDLQSGKNIDFIKIYNRKDCCSTRGQNMLLELFDASNNLVYSRTVDLFQAGANIPVNVNVLDVFWGDGVTSLNRTALDSGTYTFNYADVIGCSVSSPISISSINPNLPASVSIGASPSGAICSGKSVTFTATPTNGGAMPTYQWYNGASVIAGETASTYVTTTLANADAIKVVMISNASPCLTGSPATSNIETVTVNPLPVAPTASATAQPSCVVPTGTITVAAPTGMNYSIDGVNYSNTSGVFSGVAVGVYSVTVKNGSGCISLGTPVSINAPIINTWDGVKWSKSGTTVPPSSTDIVVFNADFTITSQFDACSCRINSGVNVVVGVSGALNDTAILQIENGLDVVSPGSLTFENNASLIQINDAAVNTGKITYKRKSSFMKLSDYTYWSSPVKGQNTKDLSPNTETGKFYSFVSNNWKPAYNVTMDPGIGYIIRTPKAGTWGVFGAANYEVVVFPYKQPVQFVGEPNNGDQIKFTLDPIVGRKNLIGNPYPSTLDANAFLLANKDILEGTIYFWTHNTAIQQASNITNGTAGSGFYAYTSDDYAAYNSLGGVGGVVANSKPDPNNPVGADRPSGKIAAGQSFMAVTKVPGVVSFKNSMREKASNTQFFKQTKNAKTTTAGRQRVWLNLTNTEGAFKQTLIGYIKGATNGYEDFFDGIKNNGNSFVDFYSVNDNTKLVIQGRALPFDPADVVPLGYSSNIEGAFAISIDEVDGDLSNQSIFIEDKETQTIHDLKSGSYSFTTKKGIFNERFALRYTNKTLGSGDFETTDNTVVVTVKNKQLKVYSATEAIDKVLVYDLSGRQLYKKERLNNTEVTVQYINSGTQALVVKVVLENGKIVTKKVIY